MRNKLQTLFLFLLVISSSVVLAKNGNKTKTFNGSHKKHDLKGKSDTDRIKRSLNDEESAPFWPNRGKKQGDDNNYNPKYENGFDNHQKFLKDSVKLLKEPPFWGNRGRRDSSSMENALEPEYPEDYGTHCEHCSEVAPKPDEYRNFKDRREDFMPPFWSSRGRRNSDEVEDLSGPFWGNRGKKQEKDPFWGNRGRRTEDSPFWGNRGRREDDPFWGNRGRRQDTDPFWGNRGRRQEQEPFWGNRGRRQENELFWSNRGKTEEEPFWGNRGRRKDSDLSNQNKKSDLKDSILRAISDVENDIVHLSRLKKSDVDPKSFWANRGRDSKLKTYFNGPVRSKSLLPKHRFSKFTEPGTVLDNRMYVDEPNYILVERSSRSSAEDDPYYISRGKKYYYGYNKASRDRRGALEEIVKSVRNDPYYIARGKKDTDDIKHGNSTDGRNEFIKVKDLICSAIDLLITKSVKPKVKREINDNDRDRRTILKKLAAQLQMDPYFVSRGKKSEVVLDEDNLHEFINNIADKCNSVV